VGSSARIPDTVSTVTQSPDLRQHGQRRIEIIPVNGVWPGRQMMMLPIAHHSMNTFGGINEDLPSLVAA